MQKRARPGYKWWLLTEPADEYIKRLENDLSSLISAMNTIDEIRDRYAARRQKQG
jgi:hypothetical protein